MNEEYLQFKGHSNGKLSNILLKEIFDIAEFEYPVVYNAEVNEIVKICMRFDVTADWLLGLSDIENPFEDAEKYKAIKALIQNE